MYLTKWKILALMSLLKNSKNLDQNNIYCYDLGLNPLRRSGLC